MRIEVRDSPIFVYTGGRAIDGGRRAVLLIHGAGHDHSVWNLQARRLAHHGFDVYAPDLPAHGLSRGTPATRIEAHAEWLEALLDALALERAALVGHSMGSLIALETTARCPDRIDRLALIGSVAPMPVASVLLDAARNRRAVAHTMINQWSYTPAAQLGASPLPGMRVVNMNRRLMERQSEGVLADDLAACNAYQGGLDAAQRVRCPTAMLCGERDQMTPSRATVPLREALGGVPGGLRVVTIPASGHAMMAEAPDAVSNALEAFLNGKA